MEELLKKAILAGLKRLADHADLVGIENVDESTFRSFILAEMIRLAPEAKCQTEWHLIDLLVQAQGKNAAIEFKFYFSRRTIGLKGGDELRKGGPSGKNREEFRACVHKLHGLAEDGITHKFIVLAYESVRPGGGLDSFRSSYDGLVPDAQIEAISCLADPGKESRGTVCRLIEVRQGGQVA